MMIAKTIKSFFTSFTIKLFICFWLITMISIASTRFITHQLSNANTHAVITQKARHNELRQLGKIVKRIERSHFKNITELLNTPHQKFIKSPVNLWFKPVDDANKIISFIPLPTKHQKIISNYLSTGVFTTPQASILSHNKLIGPALVSINNKSYQLFTSQKLRKRNFGKMLNDMPYWIRIGIPTVVSLIFCLLLARSFSKPVRMIKAAATKLGQGDFTTRVEGLSQRSDELGQLANSFNQMAEQLQQQQSAQKRLLGDVSHELRSPMTRLQMALGLAQQEATTAKKREQYLQRCQIEIDRLDKMVANVLSLSRLENTLQVIETEKINFASLLDTIVSDEQFIADEKSINIISNYADDIYIDGDRALLMSAISNVLNNAVKYSPKNSTVTVNLTQDNQRLYLSIEDEGSGAPEEELSQLFSPFYRVNIARDRETGGTGLGLAIAKQAILAHKGKITAQNRTEDIQLLNGENSHSTTGLSVSIELPCL